MRVPPVYQTFQTDTSRHGARTNRQTCRAVHYAGCDASPGGAARIGLPKQRVWADSDRATTRPTDRRHVFDGCDLDETLGPGVGCQREGRELRSGVAGASTYKTGETMEFQLRGGNTWTLYAEQADEWAAAYPGLDVEAEAAVALAWYLANPSKQPVRLMKKALNTWLKREWRKTRRTSAAPQPTFADWRCPHRLPDGTPEHGGRTQCELVDTLAAMKREAGL